ncbi:MFS transporter [Fusibacter bizertensis]|uniref:MFS transporter n=1 Tax=Fusibacter bizertensis TaxID=1488331 RepID=A0ABT6NCM2_9FIRM|nr:MFS transporter [Fusibacter bizertensis]MDH8678172.1 MFS transporter [Fusibacter bizertensis]
MEALKKRTLWGFGFGNIGFGLTTQIISAYLVFYATVILGMSGASIGLLVSLGIIWDALSDPIMGYLSDLTRNKRFGRRHLYLIIGGIGATVVNLGLWFIPASYSDIVKWLLMIILVLLVKTFLTIFITPYTALAAEISDDYTERTRIQAVKTTFFLLGLFLATAFGMLVFFRSTPEFPIGQLNPAGYHNMAIFASVIMFLSMIAAYTSTKHLIPQLNERVMRDSSLNIKSFFFEIGSSFKNVDFRAVVLGYLFTNIASALISTLGLHVYTYTFGLNNTGIAAIVGSQLVLSIASQPFWIKYTDRHEKKTGIKLGLKLAFAATAYFVICVIFKDAIQGNVIYLLPFGIIAGFGTGGLFTLPQAMVADAVDAQALKTGARQEGVFYGTLTLCYKLSQSVAIFLLGFALDFLKFDSKLSTQLNSTVIGLALLLAVGAIASFGLAYLSYKPYSLTRSRMTEIHIAIKTLKN